MELIIDRIEDGIAVCETKNGEMINIKIQELPLNIKEGNKIIKTRNTYQIADNSEDEERIKKKFDSLF